jgi:hypothetical protein
MTIDRRLIDIQLTADDREPTHVYKDQMAVIVDNLIYSYLRDPQKTDAMLRRDGLTMAADQLEKVFGAKWWEKL